VFDTVDVLLMPTVPTPAGSAARFERAGPLPTVLASTDQVGYTTPWNVVGFPAVSVPAGHTEGVDPLVPAGPSSGTRNPRGRSGAGLPLAVQLVGPPGSEGRLLRLAAQLERERPWLDERPPDARSR
jgi:amidase